MSLCLISERFNYPDKYLIASIALGLFILGIIIMILYYSYCHPNRRRLQNANSSRKGEEDVSIPMTSKETPASEMLQSSALATSVTI